MAERLAPELPMPVPVTMSFCLSLFNQASEPPGVESLVSPILDTQYSILSHDAFFFPLLSRMYDDRNHLACQGVGVRDLWT